MGASWLLQLLECISGRCNYTLELSQTHTAFALRCLLSPNPSLMDPLGQYGYEFPHSMNPGVCTRRTVAGTPWGGLTTTFLRSRVSIGCPI